MINTQISPEAQEGHSLYSSIKVANSSSFIISRSHLWKSSRVKWKSIDSTGIIWSFFTNSHIDYLLLCLHNHYVKDRSESPIRKGHYLEFGVVFFHDFFL
jgi:hypothetical protein